MINYSDKTIRSRPLYDMFAAPALPRCYDLINRVITWGFDKQWRREAARECLTSRPGKVLDLCCGTGDLVIDLARLAESNLELTGVDYSQPMIEVAAKKAETLASSMKITFTCGDATDLPFPDGYFDSIGISFAFRNLTYKNPLVRRHLAEILRVLNTSGKFVIVETSQPRAKLVRKLYHLYLRWFVSRLGYLFSGNRGAYSYLAESAARFYTPEEVKEVLFAVGFRQVSFRPLFLGAIGIHVAIK